MTDGTDGPEARGAEATGAGIGRAAEEAEGALDAARLRGEIEALQGSFARVWNALDAVLPLARGYMLIDEKDGGPARRDFVRDPDAAPDEAGLILPEILAAEATLHATSGALREPVAEAADFSELPEEEFRETRRETTGDPLLDALHAAGELVEGARARRIAGLAGPGDPEAARAAAADIVRAALAAAGL